MTTTTPTAIRVTRYLAVPALALGLAIGSAAAANAVPEWDIGGYDSCVSGIPTIQTPTQYEMNVRECCVKSGGIYNFGEGKCVAPGVESQGRNPLPNGAPTHVMQPSPLPAPPGDIGAPGGVVTAP